MLSPCKRIHIAAQNVRYCHAICNLLQGDFFMGVGEGDSSCGERLLFGGLSDVWEEVERSVWS